MRELASEREEPLEPQKGVENHKSASIGASMCILSVPVCLYVCVSFNH